MRVIESEVVERDYGMRGIQAIVEDSRLGRILIEDGFGGLDTPTGGAVRWCHGSARKCGPNDTLASLRQWHLDEHTGPYRRLDQLSLLPWTGEQIERLANRLAL